MLKQFRLLTRPTPARQDAPFRRQGRSESKPEAYPRGYVEDFDEPRTKLADCFSILLESLSIRARSRYDAAMSLKVMTRDQLVPLLRQAQVRGKRIVFTNGCFDLMHVGHTRYLQAAKDLGDLLVVAVNSDASVRSLNKAPDRPIVSEAQRAEVVAALGCVDYVILFNEPDPQSLVAALQPDVLVKGGDWAVERIVGREIVEARGGVVRTIPLVPGVSTTSLIQRIRSTTI